MKLKSTGFTLIELLVTILLIGILGSMAAPSFKRTFQSYFFQEDFTELYDTILEARSLSLSKKVCPSMKPSMAWGIHFDSTNQDYSLICDDSDQVRSTIRTKALRSDHTFNLFNVGVVADAQDEVELHFLPQQLNTELFFEGASEIYDQLRLVLQSPSLNQNKTICVHRIQGFPDINDNGSTCPL